MYSLIPVLLFINILDSAVSDKPYYNLAEAEKHFDEFITKYNKVYPSQEEYFKRFKIFVDNLGKINDLNDIHEAEHKVSILSDVTYEELVNTYCGLALTSARSNTTDRIKVKEKWIRKAPKRLDYRKKGLVTEVKNQASCGACFAFSAVGNVEGQYAKKHGKLVSLSDQQTFDCSTGDCNGGLPIDALSKLVETGGLMTEEDYQYVAQKGQCHTDKSKILVKVTSAQEIDTSTEAELKGALAHFGPLSATLYMSSSLHHSGTTVMSPTDCDNQPPNHAIVIVGYGKEKKSGKRYWIIKNSWTSDWADHGYFKLEMGQQLCMIGQFCTSTATVE